MADDDTSLQVGAHVAGRYEIRARLGAGGMGVVYEVVDRHSEEALALKTLRRGACDPQLIKREFRALADVLHPNLVQLYDLFDAAGVLCLTMELVPGVDLMTELCGAPAGSATATLEAGVATRPVHAAEPTTERQPVAPPRDLERVRDRFAQLARGLAALHRRQIVHRDIKPHNVRVTPEGRVVVLDFGLATTVGAAGSLAGTIAYMAPEQADGASVSPAADWYSFGIMLHEVLTGRVPWSGAPHDVLRKKRDEDAPPLRAIDAPDDLAALVGDLVRRDPAERPSAERVLERLGRRRAPRATRSTLADIRMIGRRAELDQLAAAWQQRPAWLAIEGGSGIGKTTLLGAFERSLGTVAVLRGRCYEREAVAYKGIDEIVEALVARLVAAGVRSPEAADLVQAFPAARDLVPEPVSESVGAPRIGHDRRGAALRALLERLAADTPVLVVLDDIQWADRDCLAVVARAFAPPGIRNLMLVVAARVDPDARWNELALPFVRIRLAALSEGEAIDLAQTLLGRAAVTIPASRLAALSGGQPLELVERVRAALSADPGAAITARELLVRRVAELSADVRAVVELAVVAGAPIPASAVASVVGRDVARAAFERAQLAGLVRVRRLAGRIIVEPAHDHVREVLFAALSPDERARRAGALATALEAGDPEPSQVAELYVIAGQPEAGRRFAERAALRMSRLGGHDAAAGLWRQIAALSDAAGRRDALARCGESLALAGRGSESAELFLALAQQATTEPERLRATRRAAEELLRAGRIEEGLGVALRNIPNWREPRSPAVALALGLLSHAATRTGRGWQRGRSASAAEIELLELRWAALNGSTLASPGHFLLAAERYLRAALHSGDPERISLGWTAQATLAVFMGSRAYAETCTERAATVLGNLAAPRARAVLLATAALLRLDDGAWSRCIALVADAIELADRHDVNLVWERNTAEISTSIAGFMRGDLATIVRHIWRERERIAARGDLYAHELVHSGFTVVADLIADEPDRATRTLADLAARPTGVLTAWLRHIGHALVGAYGHETAWHRARCDELLAGDLALPLMRSAMVRGTLLWSRATLELASPSTNAHATATWIAQLRRVPARGMRGLADLLAGHAALRAGNAAEARTRGAAAELALHADDMPVFAAAARTLVDPSSWPTWRDALAGIGAVRPAALARLFAPVFPPRA